jgi:hypothetical protein
MPFVLAIVAIIAVIYVGFLIVGWIDPSFLFDNWVARISIMHLIGAGAVTWLLSVYVMLAHRLDVWPVYAFIVIGTLFARKHFRRRAPLPPNSGGRIVDASLPPGFAPLPPNSGGRVDGGLEEGGDKSAGSVLLLPSASACERRFSLIALICGGVICIALLCVAFRIRAGMGYDAYAMWALKAKSLFVNGNLSFILDAANRSPGVSPVPWPYCAHADYPLMLPLYGWWIYAHFGRVAEYWMQAIDILFYLNLVVLFYFCAREEVKREYALMGAAVLVAARVTTMYSGVVYADIVLAAYFLTSGFFLYRTLKGNRPSDLAALCLLSGSMVMLKNEALAWVFLTLLIFAFKNLKAKQNARTAYLLLSIVVGYLPWWLIKHSANLDASTLKEDSFNPISQSIRILLPRSRDLCVAMGRQLFGVGPQYPAWGLGWILIIASSLRVKLNRTPGFNCFGLLALSQLCIYMLLFLQITNFWYWVTTFLDRALLHVFPSLLLFALITSFREQKES